MSSSSPKQLPPVSHPPPSHKQRRPCKGRRDRIEWCSGWNCQPWPSRSQNWMFVYFIIILSRSQQFPTSSSQNQVELGEWATGHFMHWWWRHQMETFSALLALCAGNSPVTGEFLSQRPVTQSFEVFFDLRLNQHLSKQWRRLWFDTPSCSLRHLCNGWEQSSSF